MKWLLILGSIFLASCATVREVEIHSKENVKSIEELFRDEKVPAVKIKENKPYPLIRSSEWVKVWKGSYFENGSVSPEGWIYLRLYPEIPETNF